MIQTNLNCGSSKATLRASLDGELAPAEAHGLAEHLRNCSGCSAELQALQANTVSVKSAFADLPRFEAAAVAASESRAWASLRNATDESARSVSPLTAWLRQLGWGTLSVAGGGTLAAAALAVIVTVAPVRAWAESLLSIFRVQHFTVLEVNANGMNSLQNNQMLNQTIGHVLSDEVTVTQSPQKPEQVADAAAATKLAGFPVKLIVGDTPTSLLVENGLAVQMKLDRDRLQSIFDEAGRSDLQVPASVDGATISVRVPAGIMAQYGNCGGRPNSPSSPSSGPPPPADATCVSLTELPSPIVSMPQGVNPAQLAQLALEFSGMSANDAANFTQTVDWTSTLVLPVMRGESSYEKINVSGNEGVLLRPKHETGHYTLMWVDSGIVYITNGTGDDTTAVNLAEQLE